LGKVKVEEIFAAKLSVIVENSLNESKNEAARNSLFSYSIQKLIFFLTSCYL
jgi:hypothetical protein